MYSDSAMFLEDGAKLKIHPEIKPPLKEQTTDLKLFGSDIDVNAIEQAKTNYPLIDFDVLDIGSPLSPKWIEMSNTKP